MDFLRYTYDMKHILKGVSLTSESIAPYVSDARKCIQNIGFGDVKDKSLPDIFALLTAYNDLAINEGLIGNAQSADKYIAKAWEIVDIARGLYKNNIQLQIAKMVIYNNDIVNIINHGQYLEAMSSLDSLYKFYTMKPSDGYDELFKEFDYQILTLWIKYYALDLDGLNVIHSTLIKLYQKLDEMPWLDEKIKSRLIADACYFACFYIAEAEDDPYIGIHLALKGLAQYEGNLKDSDELEDFETQVKLTQSLGTFVKQSKAYEVLKHISLQSLSLGEKAILSNDIDVQYAMHEFGKVMQEALDDKTSQDSEFMYQLYDLIGYGRCLLAYRYHYEKGMEKLKPFITKSRQILAKTDENRIKSAMAELYFTYAELAFKVNDFINMDEYAYQCYLLKNEINENAKDKIIHFDNLTYISENAQRLSHNGCKDKAKKYYLDAFKYFDSMEISKDNLINYRHYAIDVIDLARIYMEESDDKSALDIIEKFIAFSILFIKKVEFDENSYYQFGRCLLIKGYLYAKKENFDVANECYLKALDVAEKSQAKFRRRVSNGELKGLAQYCLGLICKDKDKAMQYFNSAKMIFSLFLQYMDCPSGSRILKYNEMCQKQLNKLMYPDEA